MNVKSLTAALISVAAIAPAFADEAKHYRHGGYVAQHARPVVVAPAYGHRPHFNPTYLAPRYVPVAPVRHAPVYNYGHNYGANHGYNHGYGHSNGHWRNGRWIAPVVIGAAILGTIAASNSYYAPPTVTYVQPTQNYIAPVVVQGHCDTFCSADRDRNGVVDKIEAGFDRTWEKWFYDIDRNNDGVITRQELSDWNRSGARY